LQLKQQGEKYQMILTILFYLCAITILVLHFTGFLKRHNIEWLVLALAVAVFPAVIYL
jgi:low affinity Fe/Cu permease